MLLFVASWPLLAAQVGQLIPAIGDGDFPRVLRVIAVALSLFLLQKLAQFGQDTLLADPAARDPGPAAPELCAAAALGIWGLETLSAGDLTYRLTEDADRIGEVIYKNIQETVPSILQLVVMFGYMISLDWQLSVATLLLAPLVAVLVSSFAGRVLTAAERSQKQVSELAGLLGRPSLVCRWCARLPLSLGCSNALKRRLSSTAGRATAPCVCWRCSTRWWASSKRLASWPFF